MRTEPNFTRDGRTPTVYIPISIRRRGGSKLLVDLDITVDGKMQNAWAVAGEQAFFLYVRVEPRLHMQ